MSLPTVHLRYRRPPDGEEVFHQLLLEDGDGVKVTLARDLTCDPPIRIEGDVALETGSDVVWFTFPDAWHDIGRFHTADGVFRGFYANILTPPAFGTGRVWTMTDLFLDVWLPPDGTPSVLDRDQFEEAVRKEWIDDEERRRALEEVEAILGAARNGAWPPPVTRKWTLERARAAVESSS